MLIKSILLSKVKQKKIPIWFMRQAGRYLPEYRKIRKQEKSFLNLCFSPQKAAQISLQPIKRFDIDGIILFSDILVIPRALGQKVSFQEKTGPKLESLQRVENDIFNSLDKWDKRLNPIYETVSLLKEKKKDKTLIGFCGSPFTVLTYMIEGGISKDHKKTKLFLIDKPKRAKKLINLLIKISIHYLKKQIDSGVDVVQLFESWSNVLDDDLYDEYIIKPNKKIIEFIKKEHPDIPTILFPKDSGYKTKKIIENIKLDCLSIDLKTPNFILDMCAEKNIAVQGKLDPVRLLKGGRQMEKSIIKTLMLLKNNKIIFNLSHGILPETPIKNVEKMIKVVKDYEIT